MRSRLKKRFLPFKINVWKNNKEEELERHLKNVVIYDFKLGNLLFNAMKAEKKAKQVLEDDMKFNIPF